MKSKIIFFFAFMSIALLSCGDDKNESDPNSPNKISEIGVWECGNYFISFSEDNFCTAYIAPNFIDCGTYTKSNDNIVTCNNNYFSRLTKYKITKLDNSQMKVSIEYTDVLGDSKQANLTLKKSSKTPAVKDNQLIGKSGKIPLTIFDTISFDFLTYNAAKKTSTKSNLKDYPLDLFYIYFNGYMYNQQFKTPNTPLSLWVKDANTGLITVRKLKFGTTGGIESMTDVSSELL